MDPTTQDSNGSLTIAHGLSHNDNSELDDDDVIFLPTGHRLIRTEAIARYDRGEISQIEYFEQFNQNPADVLSNAFQYTTEQDPKRFNRLHTDNGGGFSRVYIQT